MKTDYVKTYFGFMLFLALMLALILNSCAPKSLCHSDDNFSYKKTIKR